MRIGIIGPTHWKKNCRIIGLSEKKYLAGAKKIAAILKEKGFEIVISPHFGGISWEIAKEFKSLGGKVIGIVPKQDTEFGTDYLDESVCSEIIDCGTWRNHPEKLNEETNALLCLGYSSGTINEIAFSKWFGKQSGKTKKVFIIKEYISALLPKESVKDLDIEYIPLKKVAKIE